VNNGPAGFTAGTVTRIEGETIYVKTANRDTVKVDTNADTQVQVTEDGTLDDLTKGVQRLRPRRSCRRRLDHRVAYHGGRSRSLSDRHRNGALGQLSAPDRERRCTAEAEGPHSWRDR
jgi:hypothetical protein